MNDITFQKTVKSILYTFAGVLFLGAFLDSISNTRELIDKKTASIATAILLTGWLILRYWIRKNKPFWGSGKNKTRLIRPNKQINLFFIGMGIVLWIPILLPKNQESNALNLNDFENLLAESNRVEAIQNNPIEDITFRIRSSLGSDYKNIAFRITSEKYGAFYFFLENNILYAEDESGNTINCTPTIGSDLNEGHSFYSIDFNQSRTVIPEHKLSLITLNDLLNSTFDFIIQEGYTKTGEIQFQVHIGAIVSGWMASCGNFKLNEIPNEREIPTRRNFNYFYQENADFDIKLISKYGQKGRVFEQDIIRKSFTSIRNELNLTEDLLKDYEWPTKLEDVETVPITFPMAIAVNGFVYELGYKELGLARVLLLKKVNKTRSMMVVLIKIDTLFENFHEGAELKFGDIPEQIMLIASASINFWKVYDEISASNTEVPLETTVIMCPNKDKLFVWTIDCDNLRDEWSTKWLIPTNTGAIMKPEVKIFLNSRTRYLENYLTN